MSPVAQHSAAGTARIPWRSWWMVGVLTLFGVMSTVENHIMVMLITPIQQDLGITDFHISWIMGPPVALAGGLAAFPIAWAADRLQRRGVILGCVAFWTAAGLASAFTWSFGSLLAARAASEVGQAGLRPASYSMIADQLPRRRLTTALSIMGLAPKLGLALTFAIGAALFALTERIGGITFPIIGTLSSWRLILFLVFAPGVVLSLLALTLNEPPRRVSSHPSDNLPLKEFVLEHWRLLALLLVGFSSFGIVAGSLHTWTPTFMTRSFGWSPAQYGPLLSVISLLGAAFIVPKGMIVDWLYGRGMHDAHVRFFTWLHVVGLPLIAAAFLFAGPYTFVVLYGLLNIIVLSYLIYLSSTLQLIAPTSIRGRLTAAFFFLSGIISGMGPVMVASLTDFVFRDKGMIGYSIVIVAVCGLLSAFLFLRMSLTFLRPYMDGKADRDFQDNTRTPPAPSEGGAPALA